MADLKSDADSTAQYEGTTTVACLPSFYPTSPAPSDPVNGLATYKCEADHMKKTGVWQLGSSKKKMDCQPGSLSIGATGKTVFNMSRSEQTTPTRPWTKPLRDHEYPGGSKCLGFSGFETARGCYDGWEFAPQSGPKYTFIVTAYDTQGLPRNYDTLASVNSQKKYDFVVALIQRVPLARLDPENRKLQPREPESAATYELKKLRPYDSGTDITSEDPKQVTTSTLSQNGADGEWSITHQFTGHGVFYLTAYVCEWTDHAKTPAKCVTSQHDGVWSAEASQLVKGTGLPPDSETALPESAFTICPQNTKAPNEKVDADTGMVQGAHLEACEAPTGYFSPAGPGHIAEKCQEGFNCNIQGMKWPVALPDYWVNTVTPVKMGKCERKGACPGSSQFVPEDLCPSYKMSLPNSDAEYNRSLQDFPSPRTLKRDPCFVCLSTVPYCTVMYRSSNM